MTMAARRDRFSTFPLSGNAHDSNPAQPIGSSYSANQPRWPTQPSIWGNGGVIGGKIPSSRETPESKGSDDTPFDAPSGSAQLNPSTDPVPWSSSKRVWTAPNHGQIQPGSSNTSPTRPRNTLDMSNGSQMFPGQSGMAQKGASFTMGNPNGSFDTTAAGPKYAQVFNEDPVEEKSPIYGMMNSMNGTGILRSNSNEQPFRGYGPSRQSSESQRQSPTSAFADGVGYSFPSNPQNGSAFSNRRSLSPKVSTFSSDARGLADSFNRMAMDDAEAPGFRDHRSVNNINPASQTFHHHPASTTWQSDVNPRAQQAYQQEQWEHPYYSSNRNSGGRNSPAGSSLRGDFSSPKPFGEPPNPRAEPWSRPGSRDPRLFQDFDRQPSAAQYLTQAQGHYFPQFYPGMTPFQPGYEQFSANGAFRGQAQAHLPMATFPFQMNQYMAPAALNQWRHKDQDSGRGVRSMLLEEFRAAGKSKRFELKDIYNHVVEFSGDQHGSRFIQEKLQTANSDEKDQVFKEIEPNALQLMKDVFGNYVIQKFFEHGHQIQKKILATQMKGQVAELSTQMYACRVVQKALEHVLVEQQTDIVEELKPKIMHIVKDANGNHVVQKIIQQLPNMCIPFIMEAFAGQVEQLAAHNYGCRVIQRILEYGTEAQRCTLLKDLHGNADNLITDQFGNYVTQHIISQGSPADRNRMIELVMRNFVTLSKHKFASNVVEKCIQNGTPEQRKVMLAKLTTLEADGSSPLPVIIKDQFGNYVVQKMVLNLDEPEREMFIQEVNTHCAELRKSSSCRQIGAIDRVIEASSKARQANGANSKSSGPGPAPMTPGFQGDLHSAAATPTLTMEQNSPQSSSPPSANVSTVEDAVAQDKKLAALDNGAGPQIQVEDQ